MKCPNCQSSMTDSVLKGASFQYCGTCKGVWMGGKSLAIIHEQFHRRASALPASLEGPVEAPRIKSRNCPQCKDVIFRGFDFLGVALDRCPKCQGLWFDAGEVSATLTNYWKTRPDELQAFLKDSSSLRTASTPLGGIVSEPMKAAGRTLEDFLDLISIFNC